MSNIAAADNSPRLQNGRIHRRHALGLALALAGVSSRGACAQAEPMPPERSEVGPVIAAYAAAWRSGDLARIAACYHDAFTLHYFGSNALSGDHVGKAAALAALADFSRRTQRRLVAIVATMAGPERGAIVARERLGIDRAAVEVERVLVYTVVEGRLHECWVYDADPRLIDRLVGPAA